MAIIHEIKCTYSGYENRIYFNYTYIYIHIFRKFENQLTPGRYPVQKTCAAKKRGQDSLSNTKNLNPNK